ncbi:hypothetical protein NPIL_99011 [Nephila pilipes]|uniref:Uncharacterized protein n=1 Tax=Nephila pilipes TaxID=299642 RepID=A0A8X6QQZ9_NEPPI|nr:hypothetical protein NPIL_99011 [Nephila pilipes]
MFPDSTSQRSVEGLETAQSQAQVAKDLQIHPQSGVMTVVTVIADINPSEVNWERSITLKFVENGILLEAMAY